MQRARSTMISPVVYVGRSGGNNQASVNMTADPITQFQGCNEHPSVLGNRAELVLTDLSEHRVRHHE